MGDTLRTEMKLYILVFFFLIVEALTTLGLPLITKRLLRVAPANDSLYNLSSNTDIPNYVICAKYCKIQECLSFSYTVGGKRCETYSRFTEEKLDAEISTTTMHFSRVMKSCADLPLRYPSGVYQMTITKLSSLLVNCDMGTPEGPWTVIHRRTKGDVNFYRKWADYKNGFGDPYGDFWIGNDNLHHLTTISRKLRVELQAWDGTWGYADYSNFQVADESQNYKLLLNGFSGNISGDAMSYNNGCSFSTIDRDHDKFTNVDCSAYAKSGWWHNACVRANLNGLYRDDGRANAMRWSYFPFPDVKYYPLKKAKMMIR